MNTESSFADRLIAKLDLLPHPEGGWYRQTHRSEERILRSAADQTRIERRASTAIYYLLNNGDYSAWHRIDADELWHFHLGDPLFIHMLHPQGELVTRILGNTLEQPDGTFQVLVPAGYWFAAERTGPRGYTLAGCTVAPGFEFEHFELASMPDLLRRYSGHRALLERLAPKVGADA
ncbi:cupin domain-containing protein [Dyella acidiphila]|uniref:Cupin domain-containing protein n=1 Tax=Dyella acidiphila TaxID=2775866 RepID=A0ABR9GFW6_9GAMM|nr:cupin domain-containing protein [Dyella acidiphila]MBE1162946.1 cupin domain-containing protein [Dyella acidiphila]